MAKPSDFEQLREKRLRFVESARENEFEEGLKRLLSELYPDNAHFIYELLQNAEDALATTVEFALTADRLTVSHNGKRPFTLNDIDSITAIGNSTKKEDLTQIGKFGVGFKAVFSYTTRPEIRSGEQAFAIVDLYVPEEIPGRAKEGETTFSFPFNRKEKPCEDACFEVERGLSLLDEKTLLFLNNINTITYELPNGSIGIIERKEIDDRVIRITKSEGDQFLESQWLRLTGPVSIDDERPSPLTVAAAFMMRLNDDSRPTRDRKPDEDQDAVRQWSIVPLDQGKVSIYFPAVKESSGLRFHIHAPFASTVARDSVREDPGNVRLVDDIASLIAAALPELCAQGLITKTFLESLPNGDDQIDNPYTRIWDVITEAFNSMEITPVRGSRGAFAAARDLVKSPSEFRKWLEPNDLPTLFHLAEIEVEQTPRWIRETDGRAGKFLAGLDALDFGWPELDYALDQVRDVGDPEDPYVPVWLEWLATKSDDQIVDLYQLIGLGHEEYHLTDANLEAVPMVRLKQRGKDQHVKGPGIYLPSIRSDTVQSRIPVVLAYFDDDEDETRASNLKKFYRAVGVKRWDESAKIKQRLAEYENRSRSFKDGDDDFARHLEDIRSFVKFGMANPTMILQTFGKVPFLQALQSNGSVRWVTPTQTFVDLPFRDTGFSALFPRVELFYENGVFAYDKEPYPLAGSYIDVEGIDEFLKLAGARVSIEVSKTEVKNNAQFSWLWNRAGRETYRGTKIDWGIEFLEEMIESESPTLLRNLWHVVVECPDLKATAVYQVNARERKHVFDSQLAQVLKDTSWVLDRSGTLKTPSEMTIEDLPVDWAPPAGPSLVNKLGFGDKARERREKKEGIAAYFREDGLSEDYIDVIQEAQELGLSPADLQDLVREKSANTAFPLGPTDDPDRRGGVAILDAVDAPKYGTEVRDRSVAVGQKQATSESRAYLRAQYTNDSDVMFCQACQNPLPFRTDDGWYFEASQFVTNRKQVHKSNVIALCPLCAALYKHARETKDEELLDVLLTTPVEKGQGKIEVPVVLNGRRAKIMFTGKHAIDIQAALGVAGEDRETS